MSNVIYPKFKEYALTTLLGAGATVAAADVRFILVDLADYTYSASHEFLSDVPSGAQVAVTAAGAASKTFTNGTFDCADSTFSAVTGDVSEALIGYIHTGTAGTSRLVFFQDTGITNAPVTPNSGDINVAWDAAGVFSL